MLVNEFWFEAFRKHLNFMQQHKLQLGTNQEWT